MDVNSINDFLWWLVDVIKANHNKIEVSGHHSYILDCNSSFYSHFYLENIAQILDF
jgi:hypothetical protein